MRVSRFRRLIRWIYRNRSITLTPEGTRFVVLALAIGLAAINTGNNLLYLLLAMMLSLIVLSGVLSEQCLRRLYIQRRLPEHLFAGFPGTAYFSIANRKSRLPSFSIHVVDVVDEKALERGVHVLHLSPESSTLRSFPLLATRRGPFHIDAVRVLTRFPFSLFVKGVTLPLRSDSIAYPPVKPLPSEIYNEIEGLGKDNSVQRRGPGVDLYNLRLYQPGDDSRTIHWKTTAKTSQLVVRETQAEDQRHVTLALPTILPPHRGNAHTDPNEEEAELFEKAVELTASLAGHFQEEGFALRALIGQEEVSEGTGEEHLYRILRALALCQLTPSPESESSIELFKGQLARLPHHQLVVLVLPWDDPRLAGCTEGAARVLYVHDLEAAHGR